MSSAYHKFEKSELYSSPPAFGPNPGLQRFLALFMTKVLRNITGRFQQAEEEISGNIEERVNVTLPSLLYFYQFISSLTGQSDPTSHSRSQRL